MNTLSKRACLLAGGILLLLAACALLLLWRHGGREADTVYIACLYQDGRLMQTIPLGQVAEPYRFTIEATEGGSNTIEVSPGGIAIVQADCPDQICVLQGRITDSLLPITCLPHRLVIELTPDETTSPGDSLDAIAY